MSNQTVGIDLGTTNSAIAYHDGVTPRIIDVTTGHRRLGGLHRTPGARRGAAQS